MLTLPQTNIGDKQQLNVLNILTTIYTIYIYNAICDEFCVTVRIRFNDSIESCSYQRYNQKLINS